MTEPKKRTISVAVIGARSQCLWVPFAPPPSRPGLSLPTYIRNGILVNHGGCIGFLAFHWVIFHNRKQRSRGAEKHHQKNNRKWKKTALNNTHYGDWMLDGSNFMFPATCVIYLRCDVFFKIKFTYKQVL